VNGPNLLSGNGLKLFVGYSITKNLTPPNY